MDFDAFIAQAWQDHADQPLSVAARLHDALPAVDSDARLAALVNLAHHVHGEHLADWAGGIAFMAQLAALPAHRPDGAGAQAVVRARCALGVAAGAAVPEVDAMSSSDRVRVRAMAAASVATNDTPRAAQLLQAAVEEARAAGLPDADPMQRAVAVTGNNLACGLAERQPRSEAETVLMISAARTAREFWARAGTWLEVERAEYRLALTWLEAGDVPQALAHADACLAIVTAQAAPPLEQFFAWEAIGRAHRAAGHDDRHAEALVRARTAFDALSEDDRAWCRPSVEQLARP